MASAAERSIKFTVLDGLRGVAALCVVQTHTQDLLLGDTLPTAYLAVDLFFLLSGFVLAHAYEERLRQGMTLHRFMLARLVRLYPLYLAGIAIAVPLAVLDMLEPVLAAQAFLFGDRPCEADFGLFGPMFRHFSHDPTPAAILRERAPNLLAWTARLWAATPETLSGSLRVGDPPGDLDPLLRCIGADYLPYLATNLAAVASHAPKVSFESFGARFEIPASPYRAACWLDLRRQFAALSPGEQSAVSARLGGAGGLDGTGPDLGLSAPASGRRIANRHWM